MTRKNIAMMRELNNAGIHELYMGTEEEGATMLQTPEASGTDFLVLIDKVLLPKPSIYDCVGTKDAEFRDDSGRVARYQITTLSQEAKRVWVDADRVCALPDEQFMLYASFAESDYKQALKILRDLVPVEAGLSPEEKIIIKEEETLKKKTLIDFSALGKDIPEPEDMQVGDVRFFKGENGWEVARFIIKGHHLNVKGILKKAKGGSYVVDVLNVHLDKRQMAFTVRTVLLAYAQRPSK